MIKSAENLNFARGPLEGWTSMTTASPEAGKWVLIQTASYRRIARLENGVWRTVDGKEEPKAVISWQEI